MQSLCNNNVLGIIVNGARRGELYSKYTYYHAYSYAGKPDSKEKASDGSAAAVEEEALAKEALPKKAMDKLRKERPSPE